MFNRNGKKIEWWWRELGLPRELLLPKSSWSFWFTILYNILDKKQKKKEDMLASESDAVSEEIQ